MAIGCEPLGGTDWGTYDIKETRDAIAFAYGEGLNVFDTADIYGLGDSERELKKALGQNRHNAFIMTKFGVRWEKKTSSIRAKTFKDISADYIEVAVNASLSRLGIDSIPMYFVHWPDHSTPLTTVIGKLEDLMTIGKIQNFGLSNFGSNEIEESCNLGSLKAYQNQFNLINKSNNPKFTLAHQQGLCNFAYGTLAQGLLTGKYSNLDSFSNLDRRSRLPHFINQNWTAFSELLAVLKDIATAHDCSISQIVTRWTLDNKIIDSVIVGIKSRIQVKSLIAVSNLKLNTEEFQRITQLAEGYDAVNHQ
ncbi:MAG: aldo/keto reductase [Pseudomonadales bacterium]|nr:aldo/keto reductase [Pseudomonadales bacterium]